eukprot:CAMPEP_0172577846 /NCGR_PEP_ID=MMETSP1067-20121228/138439_1 /TAXON_ID=265564 ORGANISM="Thalassiosira punctigera, Strain Tpunct2005C2" /NCGR_SAMPLE_ID=MMETSP1067 /ASSEMBLY_ACC=CAM_ASM_000444 /LENGTH=999 /DNA_ID=CAMNT_0013370537 /DNA_START=165 /DNA_END=3164 /DNA_ORIENTATION=+
MANNVASYANFDNKRTCLHDIAQDEDVRSSIVNSQSSQHDSVSEVPPHQPHQPPCTSLQPIPPPPAAAALDHHGPASAVASAGLDHERQTLLLMLLGQVCSLHDATPRTFVVHVIALYERGILDSNSIRFLFDLGLVPRGYDLNRIGDEINGEGDDEAERAEEESNADFGGCDNFANTESRNNKTGGHGSQHAHTCEEYYEKICSKRDEGAIVPYCAEANQQPWTRYFPPPSSSNSTESNLNLNKKSSNKRSPSQRDKMRQSDDDDDDDSLSKEMAHRKKEASAIRKHLERHESLESSVRGSIYGSFGDVPPGITAAASSSTASIPSKLDNNDRWNRAISSAATQNSLTSADESFDNPSLRGHHLNMRTIPQSEMPKNASTRPSTQTMPPPATASWSVEHHPLSLSRYQRDFHQLSLLATGSFGSVYHAIHKLEQKPYAVKRVAFDTVGYYAEALALVIREVRCLAQLDHPNCVRYYTSWLEPSWMTGDQKEAAREDGDGRGDDYTTNATRPMHPAGKGGGGTTPKLLTDIERVVEGLYNTEQIDHSVEQLEAILYGNDKGVDMDDGFDWASSSPQSTNHSSGAFSFDSAEQKEAIEESWGDLPSHRTNNYQSVNTFNAAFNGGDSSDVSEWTQDLNDSSSGSMAGERESFRNPRGRNNNYARQGSLELVPAGKANNPRRRRRPYEKKISSPAVLAATYKYQISFYIQMQLCHPSTLADWIRRRNEGCADFDVEEKQARARPAFEVFRQIVNGLAHVHSKGIIHRDLKPANIFAGDDGFMLGDFGLSKMVRDANNRGVDDGPHTTAIILPSGYGNGIHTAGVGTASYASPEQTTSKTYGTAADIFSLGLILLELFSNFTSEHERGRAFHDCRQDRELAPWMKRYYPEVSALILACTQAEWRLRPSASDIQAAGVFREEGNVAEIFRAELRTLKAEMTGKDKVIRSQREQIVEKDEVIEKLRRRLAKLENGKGLNAEVDIIASGNPIDIEDSGSSSDDDY